MIAGLVLAQALSFHPMNMTADRLWGVYRIKSSGTQLVVRWLGSRKYEARGKLSVTHVRVFAVTYPGDTTFTITIPGRESCVMLIPDEQTNDRRHIRGELILLPSDCQGFPLPTGVPFRMDRGGRWR